MAQSYNNLAGNLNALEDFDKAFDFAQKSCLIISQTRGASHPLYGRCLTRKADAEFGLNRWKEAKYTISGALNCLIDSVSENHIWLKDARTVERKILAN